ncbi:hypothetical protein BpHYR1_035461 [Brachionus plicatilis]|uniref:Uncharacterized protein n=1 Tax=Brachionus plicatilis TaxID=10195 RepID=A0A3M7PFL6_BRAPC|nr:hypothetical protein BpHYR1_035461 [Brachionus plicatilis]
MVPITKDYLEKLSVQELVHLMRTQNGSFENEFQRLDDDETAQNNCVILPAKNSANNAFIEQQKDGIRKIEIKVLNSFVLGYSLITTSSTFRSILKKNGPLVKLVKSPGQNTIDACEPAFDSASYWNTNSATPFPAVPSVTSNKT